MWYRVFCPTAAEVPPVEMAEFLHARGFPVVPHFKGDDLGWTTADLALGTGTPIYAARFLTTEDSLRHDLQAFAAELETMTHSPHAERLMERVIQAKQLVTLRRPLDHPNESLVAAACEALAGHLALVAGGFYQIDGRGWFDADGSLLVEEF